MEKKTAFISAKPTLADSENPVGFPGVTDGWAGALLKMLDTQNQTDKHLREYIRTLHGKKLEQVGETEEQRYLAGQLLNQTYDKYCNQANPEQFVNTGTKLLTEFMSEDFLISKPQMFSSWVDEELFKEANKYTGRDSLLIIAHEIETNISADLQTCQKWFSNLEDFMTSNRYELSGSSHDSRDAHTRLQLSNPAAKGLISNKAKELQEWLLQEVCRLEAELSLFQTQRTELRDSLTSIRGSFEKPSIDISAKVKYQLGKMFEVQEKLLFTLQDNKELPVAISAERLQRMVTRTLYSRYKDSALKIIYKSSQLLSTTVFSKYLSQSKERLFTKFDLHAGLIRETSSFSGIHVTDGLEALDPRPPVPPEGKDLSQAKGISNTRPHPSMTDFYLHLLSVSGQADNYVKIVTSDRKLTNLTISKTSLSLCALGLRADYQHLAKVLLEDVMQQPDPENYFEEIPNFPKYIFRVITDSMDSFRYSDWILDSSAHQDTEELLPPIPSELMSLLSTAEHLDNFNHRVARNFTAAFESQSKWLEFEDYYQPNRILEINILTARIRECLNRGETISSVAQCVYSEDRLKMKSAFWVQHNLLFKLSQKTSAEHTATLMLRDQMKHPQIDTWLNLVLHVNLSAAFYDLEKFTQDLFELIEVNPDNLKSEKRLACQTLESYTKLLILRSRSAFVRLLSYSNFARSAQKSINLHFLRICEHSQEPEDTLGSEPLKHFRKHYPLKQSKMFDHKDYEEVKTTFDEDLAATKTTELLARLFGDIKYSRLVSNPGHKPFLFTNPSKGGSLGGCIPGMTHQTEDEMEEQDNNEVLIADSDNLQSQRQLGGGTKKSIPPDHVFAEDNIKFVSAPSSFLEHGLIGDCPLAEVRDSTGTKILYDAATHDAFEIVHDLSCLISFFLENELAFFQDDQFEDLDVQFQSNQADEVLTTKNYKSKIPFFEKHFNYEYLVTRILEAECLFQSAKTILCDRLLRYSGQVCDQQATIKIYELVTDLMAKRPDFDLQRYDYLNENMAEWLNRLNLSRDSKVSHRGELHNLVTTIFDNYAAETDYLKNLDSLLQVLLCHEQKTVASLSAVFELFGVSTSGAISTNFDMAPQPAQGMGIPECLLQLKPNREGFLVADIIRTIDGASEQLQQHFIEPSYVDRVTFSSFLFDFHFKDQIDTFLGLDKHHQTDFLGILNDLMNSPQARYKSFIQQLLKLVVIGEAQDLVTSVLEHKCSDRDDLVAFEGDLLPTESNVVSAITSTVKFFRSHKSSSRSQCFSDNRGCNIINREELLLRVNQYHAYWLALNQNLDVRESLLEASYLSLVYKAQKQTVRPVYEALGKNLRFEKPDDMLHTVGDLLEKFLDLGDSCKLTLDDVRSILKEDLHRGSNQVHHLSRLQSLRRLLLLYVSNLSLAVQSNAFTEKIAECEVSLQACKVLSNKESVMEYLYKFDMEQREDRAPFTPSEVMEDYKRGETSFKYHLHQYQWSFIQILSSLLQAAKQDSCIDFRELVSRCTEPFSSDFKGKDSLMFGYDPEEAGSDGQLSHYFRENLFEMQDEERSSVPADFHQESRVKKNRLCVAEIPAKDSKYESISITMVCDPFIAHMSKILRRSSNLLAIWLQSRKLVQNLYDKDAFISFNPTEVVSFHKESDLTFGKLQVSLMKILQFKYTKQIDDGSDKYSTPFSIFDEYGSLKYIFKVPTSRGFKDLLFKDLDALVKRSFSPKEASFFSDIELLIFKRSKILNCELEHQETSKSFETATSQEIGVTSQPLRDTRHEQKLLVSNAQQARDYTESYLKEILAHLRKLKTVEIDEINRSAPSSVIDKQTTEKVLSALDQINFKFGKKTLAFGGYLGFASDGKLSQASNPLIIRKTKVDRAVRASSYDYYHIEEIQETDIFLFYSQTAKLLDTVAVKLLVTGLDMEPLNMELLFKKSMPFYTLNSLRLQELDKLLFNSPDTEETLPDPVPEAGLDVADKASDASEIHPESADAPPTPSAKTKRVTFAQDVVASNSTHKEPTEQSPKQLDVPDQDYTQNHVLQQTEASSEPKPQKFEYRKLRQYLYVVKRIELKNRSASRSIFTFVDELKDRMNSVLEDAKLSKPDLVFNTYLNCLYENEQRTFVLGLIDSVNQLRWVENFNDLIDMNLEKIKSDKEFLFQTRSVLMNLLFKKTTTFGVFFDLFTNQQVLTQGDCLMEAYPYKRPSVELQNSLRRPPARKVVKKNNLLNLFDKAIVGTSRDLKHFGYRNHNRSFGDFTNQSFDFEWSHLFAHLLSLRTPQRTYLSRKIFDIKLYTERNVSMPKESIMPHNLWIYNSLDAHRLLDLNLKNMLLIEALNLKIMNDLYCDRGSDDRASVQLDEKQMNGVRVATIRRQIKPSLMPFVTNSMFSREPNYEFSRMLLRLMSTELRMTSFVLNKDLRTERFPDLNFDPMHPENSNTHQVLDEILKKHINVDAVWADEPLDMSVPVLSHYGSLDLRAKAIATFASNIRLSADESVVDGDLGSDRLTTDVYTLGNTKSYVAGIYNDHKVEILKCLVDSFRNSFFLPDVPQAFTMCYLLMREFMSSATSEEVSQSILSKEAYFFKSPDCQSRDKLAVSLQKDLLYKVVKKSFILETSLYGDQVAIKKSTLHELIHSWNHQVGLRLESELRRRELSYLEKIDNHTRLTEQYQLEKDLVDFYFKHTMKQFNNIVNSRLAFRNSSFICELDSLQRFSLNIKYDMHLMFDKISDKLVKKSRDEILALKEHNRKLRSTHLDAVKKYKLDLTEMIDQERQATLERMKEHKYKLELNEIEPHDPVANGKFYQVQVSVYQRKVDSDSESEYHRYAVKLFQNLRLLRAFASLKVNCKINKEERQLYSIETQNQDKELLTSRLEELLKAESASKEAILTYQKNIAKLEIQNNLLRKEIHNSQFERIKLLKRVNEVNNQYDEVNWEQEKVTTEVKAQIKAKAVGKSGILHDYNKEYLKSLFAEHNTQNVDILAHPERLSNRMAVVNSQIMQARHTTGSSDASSLHKSTLGAKPASSAVKIKYFLANEPKLMELESVAQNKEIAKVLQRRQQMKDSVVVAGRPSIAELPIAAPQEPKVRALPTLMVKPPEALEDRVSQKQQSALPRPPTAVSRKTGLRSATTQADSAAGLLRLSPVKGLKDPT